MITRSKVLIRQRGWPSLSVLHGQSARLFPAAAAGVRSVRTLQLQQRRRSAFTHPNIVAAVAVGGIVAAGGYFAYKSFIPRPLTEEDSTEKRAADALPGYVVDKTTGQPSTNLQRVKQTTTRLPLSVLASNGVKHGQAGGTRWLESSEYSYFQQSYWNDEAAYVLNSSSAQQLRDATFRLHAMCLEAVDLVVQSDDLMEVFEIPVNMREAVRESWQRRDRDLLGRFDISWDGQGEPKLLEYNADTPTILVETAVGQRLWWDHVRRGKGEDDGTAHPKWCFNVIEAHLAKAWPRVVPQGTSLCVAGANSSLEEQEHAAFVAKSAAASGIQVKSTVMGQLGVFDGSVVNTEDYMRIPCIWKMYPYEWLAEESLGVDMYQANTDGSKPCDSTVWIEPAWKLVLGNKALLALLWELNPNHPNLLPATYNDEHVPTFVDKQRVVAKPKYGREGNGIVYSHDFDSPHDFLLAAIEASTMKLPNVNGDDDSDSFSRMFNRFDAAPTLYLGHPVFQAYHETAKFSGRRIVIGSWVIHGQPSGICFREDVADTTNDNSSFVPHYVEGPAWTEGLPALSARQQELYESLYPTIDTSITGRVHSTVNHVQRIFGFGAPADSPNLARRDAAARAQAKSYAGAVKRPAPATRYSAPHRPTRTEGGGRSGGGSFKFRTGEIGFGTGPSGRS